MRKLVVSLLLGLAVLALAATASATHQRGNAYGGGAKKDFVFGFASLNQPTPLGTFPATNQVDAESEPGGANPTGHFVTEIFHPFIGTIHLEGDVTCLNVQNNVAIVGGVITQSNTALAPPGVGTFGMHVDNGKGKKATAPDAVFATLTGAPPPPEPCTFAATALPVTDGGYTVHQSLRQVPQGPPGP